MSKTVDLTPDTTPDSVLQAIRHILPGCTGFVELKYAWHHHRAAPHIPVYRVSIIPSVLDTWPCPYSGSGSDESLGKAFAAAVDDYFKKKFDHESKSDQSSGGGVSGAGGVSTDQPRPPEKLPF